MASSPSTSRALQYPYPSTINPSSFVSIKLSGTHNYSLWETQMLCLLECQDLVGFIDGTIPAPPETIMPMHGKLNGGTTGDGEAAGGKVVVVNEEYGMWKRSDRLVKGWILGSLQEHVLGTVVGLSTAMDVWAKLRSTFGPNLQAQETAARTIARRQGSDFKKLEQTFNIGDTKYVGGITTGIIEVSAQEIDISKYLPLYKAALVGDWEATKRFLDREIEAETAIISGNQETLLHVAVATGKAIHFVEKLVERLPKEALAIQKSLGETTLNVAAMVGNTKAAKILMEKNPSLFYISDQQGNMPLHSAAFMGHWNTFTYLRSVSSDDDYVGQNGVDLLSRTISGGQFDTALDLIKRYPHVARLEPSQKCMPPLSVIAGKNSSFRSGDRLNFLESVIYSCIPVKFDNYFDGPSRGDLDIENPTTAETQKRVHSPGVCQRLHIMLWDALESYVPAIKAVGQKKLVHHQAVKLVKCLCEGIRSTHDQAAYVRRTYEPITKAASLGIVEAVEEIVDIIPVAFWSYNNKRNYITQLSVINRCEKVFNLVYQMNGYQQYITRLTDDFGNNILHLAGFLAPAHKLNLVSGAALQMQRELQWFKEVEKLNPACIQMMNNSGETPAMVFTREHRQLVIDGEKWMNDTANSCTIAAALIITMVFAAAITVPGGNNGDTGFPIFNNGPAFLLFAVSDAISLFTSTTSLLMFLSILTARYAEQDFLHALPKRLVIGLLTLFISITSMIVAFSTTVYLVFGEKKRWVIIPLAALSCLPITSFVTLQFPLLIDVFSSTFGRGIFGKQSDRPFH